MLWIYIYIPEQKHVYLQTFVYYLIKKGHFKENSTNRKLLKYALLLHQL